MKRIKNIVSLGLATAMIFGLAACGNSSSSSSTAATASIPTSGILESNNAKDIGTTATSLETTTAVSKDDGIDHTQGDKITIKIAHVSQEGVPIDVAMHELGDTLNQKTGGRITVQVFPSSQLGGNTELMEQLQMGTLEMAISSVAFLGGFTNSTKVLDLPYLFYSNEAAEEVLDGEIGQNIFSALDEQGFHGLAWLSTGWRHLTANKEIHKPDDLKGLKIRVMENQMHIDAWNQLGASAVPMAFSELYTALQNGTMDCEENPWANIDGNRLYEVQKYIIETAHIYDTSPLLASKSWWDSLSSEDQKLIQECVNETLINERKLSHENEAELRDKIGNNGTNVVIELTDEERQAFKDAEQPVYQKYVPEIGQNIIDQVEAVNKKYSGQ